MAYNFYLPAPNPPFARLWHSLPLLLFFKRCDIHAGIVARQRIEFIQRSAGMPEPPARNHRHIRATGCQHRCQHQADFIADAAGRMFVDNRFVPQFFPTQFSPESLIASVNASVSSRLNPFKKTAIVNEAA